MIIKNKKQNLKKYQSEFYKYEVTQVPKKEANCKVSFKKIKKNNRIFYMDFKTNRKKHGPGNPGPNKNLTFEQEVRQFMVSQKEFNKSVLEILTTMKDDIKNLKADVRELKIRMDNVEQRLDKIDDRLDNLVKKNKLKE